MQRFTFDPGRPVYSASSPGRLDVMGGIADYSGSLLLQMPIAEKTTVSIQLRDDRIFRISSAHAGAQEREALINLDITPKETDEEFREHIRSQQGGEWATYVVGCFIILNRQTGIPITGADMFISSDVPVGKGVSSSAALEVATMLAIMRAYGMEPDRILLPLWAQQVENRISGAACGLMDQLSVCLGEKKKLLPLICQPHTVLEALPIPAGVQFSGLDSGVRHAVEGASYGDVRTAAFMSYSIIAAEHGIGPEVIRQACLTGSRSTLPYGGYLSNIPISIFEQRYASSIPVFMKGSDFLTRFGGTIDTETQVDPVKTYALSACARHPVHEHSRVSSFARLLSSYSKSRDKYELLCAMGELMMQSHASYSMVGLGNPRTDEIVDMVREAGPAKGVYGARISGGGSGGTVVVMTAGKEGKAALRDLYTGYRRKYGRGICLFSGSSDGALI